MTRRSGKYEIIVTPRAQRSLKRLAKDKGMFKRIDKRIKSLSKDPRPDGCKKLKASKHGNTYRVREGDWRILYAIEDEVVVVLILDVVRRDRAYHR
jgi:mRNA interferase RelE/StbE